MMQEDLSITTEIKLYYDLYIPENAEGKLPLLISIHGYGAHKRYMMREARAISGDGFAIASLQAPHQHFRPANGGFKVGFGWLTDYKAEESVSLHHNFILGIIDKLKNEGLIDEGRIYLFGFSQACALNFRFAFTYPEILRGIIGLCGGIPGDLDTSGLYREPAADTLYLYGNNDEFYPLEKFTAFDEKLRSRLKNYSSKLYEAKHEITDEMREDAKNWLKEKSNR